MAKVRVPNSLSFEKTKPKAFTESVFDRLAPAAEGPWHCCGLLRHFPLGEAGKVRRGAWELRRASGDYVRPREQEEGSTGAVPAMTHPCLALDLSTRAVKAGGLLMTFTLRSRGLNALPQCSSLSHSAKPPADSTLPLPTVSFNTESAFFWLDQQDCWHLPPDGRDESWSFSEHDCIYMSENAYFEAEMFQEVISFILYYSWEGMRNVLQNQASKIDFLQWNHRCTHYKACHDVTRKVSMC